jgi:hypothetical protein
VTTRTAYFDSKDDNPAAGLHSKADRRCQHFGGFADEGSPDQHLIRHESKIE